MGFYRSKTSRLSFAIPLVGDQSEEEILKLLSSQMYHSQIEDRGSSDENRNSHHIGNGTIKYPDDGKEIGGTVNPLSLTYTDPFGSSEI